MKIQYSHISKIVFWEIKPFLGGMIERMQIYSKSDEAQSTLL